ncbi:MAG: hypothetical protein HYU36_09140 [Planctomycetes bacterium]|nr:hypothetical protein [Planctomycetota bacterium]
MTDVSSMVVFLIFLIIESAAFGRTEVYVWSGEAADEAWSSSENWKGNRVPGQKAVVIFDETSSKNCNIGGSIRVSGLHLLRGYHGNVTQAEKAALQIGSFGYKQEDGCFTGGDAPFKVYGPFWLEGGLFSSPSGIFEVSGEILHTRGVFHWGHTLPGCPRNFIRENIALQSPSAKPPPIQGGFPDDPRDRPDLLRIDSPVTSRTSPAWLEGFVHPSASRVQVSFNDGPRFDAFRMNPYQWFADNASGEGGPQGIRLSAQEAVRVKIVVGDEKDREISRSVEMKWQATDLARISGDALRIRVGESLLLTATGQGKTLRLDTGKAGTESDHHGEPGQSFVTPYITPGTFVARAYIDGQEVGKLTLHVIDVDFHGPSVFQVGYAGTLDVTIRPSPELGQVGFAPNDLSLLQVSVKADTGEGTKLLVTPLQTGPAYAHARLGDQKGPILRMEAIRGFQVIPLEGPLRVDLRTGSIVLKIILQPYIPDLKFRFLIEPEQKSYFEGGFATLDVNTTDDFYPIRDPQTGMILGEYEYTIVCPPGMTGIAHSLEILR